MFSSDVDAVIKRANSTEYGLASGIFTSDINKAMYFVDKIDSGTVFINTYNKTDVAAPFGGFKQSGFGKDLGKCGSFLSFSQIFPRDLIFYGFHKIYPVALEKE